MFTGKLVPNIRTEVTSNYLTERNVNANVYKTSYLEFCNVGVGQELFQRFGENARYLALQEEFITRTHIIS